MWVIILDFHQAAHVSLIQNESYQESLEKKNNGEHHKVSHSGGKGHGGAPIL